MYGRTNMYRPLNSNRNNGNSGEYVIHAGGGPLVIAAKFAMTVRVKNIDIQRWNWRIHLFQFMANFSE